MSKDNEVDLYEFAKLFDAALVSDNPSVKKALRNFMLVASIAESESSEVQSANGMASVFDRVSDLEKRLDSIEQSVNYSSQRNGYAGGTGVDWLTKTYGSYAATATDYTKHQLPSYDYDYDYRSLLKSFGDDYKKTKKGK